MKAVESNLFKLLQGSNQFVIPIYQRTYSWTKVQCEQLWNDIIKSGTDKNIPGHFIGSVVYIDSGIYQVSTVNQLLVIDGQQRLTTISLLISALARAIEEKNTDSDNIKEKLNNYYLFNSQEEGLNKYKLILTQSDKETYFSILKGSDIPGDYSNRIVDNYNYFVEKIIKSNIDPKTILNGVSKLFIVDVSLDKNYDNPQLIFESLNSTGLDLSQADLIRNFILMGQEQKIQEDLYNDYWFPMEQSFSIDDTGGYFDGFMRDYLTIKINRIPTFGNIYKEFKKYYFNLEDQSITDIVSDIKYFSQFWVNIAFHKSSDKELNEIFKDIESLKVWVAYPFFLEVYSDYEKGIISREDFIDILKTVESYVFRRAIVGIPTNSLNKTFANMYKEIDKTSYVESFYAAMLLKDSYRRFPDDDEFMLELMIKDVYNFRNRNYLLRKIENYDRKEKVEIGSYTIEHILPQNKNLSKEWREMLGEKWSDIQKKYLHTIGNLTLTGYNPELSDRPFVEKRDMEGGFKDSPIRLNNSLGSLEKWDEDEIINRAEEIANKAVKVWKCISLPDSVLDKYRKEEKKGEGEYTIEHFSNFLQADILELYTQLRRRILNLDSSVKEEFKKLYIAYKNTTNFVDIIPQKKALICTINLDYDEVVDPNKICRDVTNLGRWGNGNVEVKISTLDEVDNLMEIIGQSYQKHAEHNGD